MVPIVAILFWDDVRVVAYAFEHGHACTSTVLFEVLEGHLCASIVPLVVGMQLEVRRNLGGLHFCQPLQCE